jgi:hypothetical protein
MIKNKRRRRCRWSQRFIPMGEILTYKYQAVESRSLAGHWHPESLSGAEYDEGVDEIIVVTLCAHQPDSAGHAERHDRDVDVRRLEQPTEPGSAGWSSPDWRIIGQ